MAGLNPKGYRRRVDKVEKLEGLNSFVISQGINDFFFQSVLQPLYIKFSGVGRE